MSMERLTKKLPDGRNILTGNFAYVRNSKYGSFVEGYAVDKLADYEEAEEQGLLLRLPCKVGDNVYKIWSCGKNGKSVAEFRISHIDIDDLQNIEFAFISTKNISTSYWFCKIGDFGKTVFLTKEEAEQALKKSIAELLKGEEG